MYIPITQCIITQIILFLFKVKGKMEIPLVLSSLKNAGLAKKPFAYVPLSKGNLKFLDLLYSEGFISGYSIYGFRNQVRVQLNYAGSELPLVASLKSVSRPGFKVYLRYSELVKYYSGRFLILNTSAGMVTGTVAIQKKKGGEILSLR